jgi:hypothetical protein
VDLTRSFNSNIYRIYSDEVENVRWAGHLGFLCENQERPLGELRKGWDYNNKQWIFREVEWGDMDSIL